MAVIMPVFIVFHCLMDSVNNYKSDVCISYLMCV